MTDAPMPLVTLIVNGGAFALLVWLAVYWLPRVSAGYSETVARMAGEFTCALRDQRQAYIDLLDKEREISERRHAENLAAREQGHRENLAARDRHQRELLDVAAVNRAAIRGLHTTVGTLLAWVQGRQGDPPPQPAKPGPSDSGQYPVLPPEGPPKN